MPVKIVIQNVYSRIYGEVPLPLIEAISKELSYTVLNHEHMVRGISERDLAASDWDGRVELFWPSKGNCFYTGMMSDVLYILDSVGFEYTIDDRRVIPPRNLADQLKFILPPGKFERPYQNIVVGSMYKAGRGILQAATGSGKCLGKGTPVLMFDGNTKAVELVQNGDLLMGPDSKPRKVLSTTKGYGPLFKIKQSNGEDFVCNDEHILCLQRTGSPSKGWIAGKEVETTASCFHSSSKVFRHIHKGYKVGVKFSSHLVPIDPYWLGLWLGDGHSHFPSITTGDNEVIGFIRQYAMKNKFELTACIGNGCASYHFIEKHRPKIKTNCSIEGCLSVAISGGMCRNHLYRAKKSGFTIKSPHNRLTDMLHQMNLICCKHIPMVYKINDEKIRLKLLAGLIDSDGNFAGKGSVEFVNVNEILARDVCWLARSLGFRSSIYTKKTSIKKIGYIGMAWRVRISGEISKIPILIKRKQAGNKTKYAANRYAITTIPLDNGDYYGFEIDGDGKFLLGDFTVTHNTFMMTKLIGSIKASPFIFFVPSVDIMDQAYECMSACLTTPIGRIGDGVFDIQEINVVMIQTAVKAIKRNDPRFKISDYRFDEEDAWDTATIAEEKAKAIDELIRRAAGIYLDEVHHAASRTCQTIMEACTSAYYRYGGSATPFREDGAEKMIKALFGKVVQKVSASWLIRNQYLVKPYIFNVKMSGMHGDWKSYPQVYKNYIVENDDLHKLVGKLAMRMKQMGIPTLILVQQYQHGNTLKKIIPDATFIRGDMPRTKRRAAISSLRDGSLPCAIATTLADEGLDVERLGCAVIAGGGKSCTRVYQRVGRVIRSFSEHGVVKDKALVFIFHHDAPILERHGRRVASILKEEPEFKIINTTHDRVMDDLNDLLCPNSTGIFE